VGDSQKRRIGLASGFDSALEIRFRSDGMVYQLLISKSREFSQSISRIAAGDDTIEGTQISGYGDKLRDCRKSQKTPISTISYVMISIIYKKLSFHTAVIG